MEAWVGVVCRLPSLGRFLHLSCPRCCLCPPTLYLHNRASPDKIDRSLKIPERFPLRNIAMYGQTSCFCCGSLGLQEDLLLHSNICSRHIYGWKL